MVEAHPGALDKLVRLNPTQVANFILSAGIVRTAVTSAGETLMLLPERGAMPVYWAADGHPEGEPSMSAEDLVQLPIGSYDFQTPDDGIKKGTLSRQQKQELVRRHGNQLEEAHRVLIIDEVQKGGTITELVDIVSRHRQERPGRLYVIAAQDSREKVSSETKSPRYQEMASGNRKGVSATIVPMPLFSTDSDVLLNQLWYPGSTRNPAEINPTIEIRPNEEAEIIFRFLGMAARNREILEDPSVLDSKVFSFSLGDKASHRIEEWRQVLIELLRPNI